MYIFLPKQFIKGIRDFFEAIVDSEIEIGMKIFSLGFWKCIFRGNNWKRPHEIFPRKKMAAVDEIDGHPKLVSIYSTRY